MDGKADRQRAHASPLGQRAADQQGQQRQRGAEQVGPAGIGERIHSAVEELQRRVGQRHGGSQALLLSELERARRKIEPRLPPLDVGDLQIAQRDQLVTGQRCQLRLRQRLPGAQPPFLFRARQRDDRQRQAPVRLVPQPQVPHQTQHDAVGIGERAGLAMVGDRRGGALLHQRPPHRDIEVAVRSRVGQLQRAGRRVRVDQKRLLVRIGEAKGGEQPGEVPQVVPYADQFTLHRAPPLDGNLHGQSRQFIELHDARADLLEAVAAAPPRRHADRLRHLRVVDQEHLVAMGLLRGQQHPRQPIDRRAAGIPLAAGVAQQRVARKAVERLGPPVLDHHQRPERRGAGDFRLRRLVSRRAVAAPEAPDHRRRQHRQHRQHRQQEDARRPRHAAGGPDQGGRTGAHDGSGTAARRRRPGRTRVWTKWTTRPMAIRAVATYGTRRPRFSTTANVE